MQNVQLGCMEMTAAMFASVMTSQLAIKWRESAQQSVQQDTWEKPANNVSRQWQVVIEIFLNSST